MEAHHGTKALYHPVTEFINIHIAANIAIRIANPVDTGIIPVRRAACDMHNVAGSWHPRYMVKRYKRF